ncbi:MAG: hypothetical protein ACYS80_02870 [Planctomycetota bacterium]|jgi:hypothetical protein
MTSETKKWDSLKSEYLRQVEKSLSLVRHPRTKDILEDVTSHLDQRFAELESQQQTWENFQAIITEMGPASDYAELLDTGPTQSSQAAWPKHLLWLGLAAIVVVGAILLLMTMPDNKVGYIVTFEPVDPFEPQTARELLDAFNENHPHGIRTHHFRTGVHGYKLQGHICVDTKAAKIAIIDMLDKSDKLILVTVRPVTQEDLKSHYALGQPSLKPEAVSKTPVSLNNVWNCIPSLDPVTRANLANFESYYQQQYHIKTGYESASEGKKSAMIDEWIREIQTTDYDKAVRAAAALGDVNTPEVAAVFTTVATAPKGSNRVKWIAVRGLAKMAKPETMPALITLLDHHNANIRTYAKVALAEISGEFFGDDKEKWQNWWQQYQQKQ